jgi:translation initiation factor IF-1
MGKNKKKNNSQYASMTEDQDRQDRLEMQGVVEEALPGTLFKVRVDDTNLLVICTLSGKLRQNHILVLPNDKVAIEVSPYDTSRGRICWRR